MPNRPPPHDYAAEAEALAHWFDFSPADVDASVADCDALAGRPAVGRVAWFVPHVASAFAAGIHTILRAADHLLRARGAAQVMCVFGAPDAAAARARIAEAFPELAAACEVVVLSGIADEADIGPTDAAFATLWLTARAALRLRGARRKLYLVQDWEPEFYPAGSTSALAEATYRFGFHAVCSNPVLAEACRELGGTAEHFAYAADPAVFHDRRPARASDAPWRLFCYGRPGNPRNCFELAAAAMREVKAALGDRIDIVTAGAGWDPADHGLGGVARNLGIIPHAEIGDVYRSADAALCLSQSRNLALVQLELMACGTPVVTARNRHAAWLQGAGAVFESEPSRGALAATILGVLSDDGRRAAHAERAKAIVRDRFSDWGPALRAIERAALD